MLFRNLYNKSFFLPKVVKKEVPPDEDSERLLNEGQKPYYETPAAGQKLEEVRAKALENMRQKSSRCMNRITNTLGNAVKHPFHTIAHPSELKRVTAKSSIEAQIDEATKQRLETNYSAKLNEINQAHQNWITRHILEPNLKKYSILTEKINVCNERINDLGKEIDRAKALQDWYKSGIDYLRGRYWGLGSLKYRFKILKNPITDSVNYKENKKVLEIVKEIKREASFKKTEYDKEIREKFRETYKLEDTIRQLVCLYQPDLAGEIEEMLKKNAFGDGTKLEQAINNLPPPVSDVEKDTLLAMAAAHRSKKGKTAKAFEIADKKTSAPTEMNEIIQKLKGFIVGNKFSLVYTNDPSKTVYEYTIKQIDSNKGLLVVEDIAGTKICFNLNKKIYTSQETGGGRVRKTMDDEIEKLIIN